MWEWARYPRSVSLFIVFTEIELLLVTRFGDKPLLFRDFLKAM